MKRMRVWLGSNRQDWYWICGECVEKHIGHLGHLLRLDFGGTSQKMSWANDRARKHLHDHHQGGIV